SLRPAIEFDEFTGAPSITFDISVREAKITTLEKILRYVESRKRRVVIALDEFQQVTRFREQNTEAQLRAAIQHCNYTHFIFSGSHRTIMTSMFGLPNRPFYNSAEMMELDAIAADVYARFIEKHFSEARKRMPFDVARYLVDICREHTYYIQFLSNRLFTLPLKKYDENTVRSVWLEVVQEQENTYYNYRNLMTENQWNLLKAVAREKSVEKITSSAFLQKHQLGTPSSVQRALQALMDAEFVFQWKGAYVVYDQFFAGWIAWKS
ncbi:MAG: ATP-binding protein, partial [Flavobacteriales bacterium]|nr:ATP-binding protein [Flavobacteriales bacterium]